MSHPENGTLYLSSENDDQFIEWQIWKGINLNFTENFPLFIDKNSILDSKGQINGLEYNLKKKWVSKKILNIRIYLKTLENSTETEWKINEIGVKLVKNAYFGPWTDWSFCSKSCIGMDEKYGQKSRKRTCFPPLNGGKSCQILLNSTSNIEGGHS